ALGRWHGSRLGQFEVQPGNVELAHQHFGQTLGKRFDQLILRRFGKGLDASGNAGIVERLAQVITRRSRPVVPGKTQVQTQALANAALPVVGADHRIDFQTLNENSVQAFLSVTRQGRDAPLESRHPRPEW
nr:hypothetical protein [Tanacetum cinerariifolium]